MRSGSTDRRIYVLDTTAFIAGPIDPTRDDLYTVPSVLEEVKRDLIQTARVEGLVVSGRVKVVQPPEREVEAVRVSSSRVGEGRRLSRTDVEVIALALHLRETTGHEVVVLSDDYSVQNVAETLGLQWSSLRHKGISARIEWEYYCPVCMRSYPSGRVRGCDVCGGPLRRRPSTLEEI
ncbi:MAG: DNA-binding protein [Aigarchaeota archaeon]|nr:DNA-binding protein [Aigarchaeota archaeon]MDW8093204.1 DNA-binding protein [Nitrososphaerota archaeon]